MSESILVFNQLVLLRVIYVLLQFLKRFCDFILLITVFGLRRSIPSYSILKADVSK
jgi:hypothetical protein